MKKSSNKTKSSSKVKEHKGGKAGEEERSEMTQKEEEASDEDKSGKKRKTGEGNLEKDEGGKEDNVDKDGKNTEKQDEKEEEKGDNESKSRNFDLDKESQNSTSSSNSTNAPGEKKSDANQPSSETGELKVAAPDTSLNSNGKPVVDARGEQQHHNQENGEEEEEDKDKDEKVDIGNAEQAMDRDVRLSRNMDSNEGLPLHLRGEDLARKFADKEQAKSEDESLQGQGKISKLEQREVCVKDHFKAERNNVQSCRSYNQNLISI